MESNKIYEFDNFRLDTAERQLVHDGRPIALASKAFDLLVLLVRNNGHLLGKEDLYNAVWPGQIVEDSNLTVQISAIRRALGRGKYIDTVIGSGYRFSADVREVGSGYDDVILESETIRRVVIEEHRVEPDGAQDLAATAIEKIQPARPTSSRLRWLPLAVVVMALGVMGAYLLYRTRPQPIVDAAQQGEMTMKRLTDGKQLGAVTISPDGRLIAYIENSKLGAGTLFVQQIDTNTVRSVLEPAERTFGCVEFSPDSSLIYYIVFDERDPGGALYSVPFLGGAPKRILGKTGSCFSLSPDGKRVAFFRSNTELKRKYLMTAETDVPGREDALIDRPSDEWSFRMGLAWSPDAKMITIFADLDTKRPESRVMLHGIDTITLETKPLSSEELSNVGKMTWTHDGRNLLFVGKKGDGVNQLYRMEYPSGAVHRVTNDLETYGNFGLGVTADGSALVANIFEENAQIWSLENGADAKQAVRLTTGATDGRAGLAARSDTDVTFVARTNNGLEIETLTVGSDVRPLTTDTVPQRDVNASPDGRHIVYSSADDAGSHIYRMSAVDGSEVSQITFGNVRDTRPDVSPDGTWIAYASGEDGNEMVWKVPFNGGAPIKLTDFPCGSPVMSPDGRLIACEIRSNTRAKPSMIAIISSEGGPALKTFPILPFQFGAQTIRWSGDGKAIVFAKPDNGVMNLWQQPIDGSPPQQLTNFTDGVIWSFSLTRDGRRIFLSRGKSSVDVVQIRNFR